MSVIKRGNSKYWYIQFQMNGETFIKSSRTTIKRAAEQMETDWRAELHAQHFMGRKPRIHLREALRQFCESRRETAFHTGWVSMSKMVQERLPANMFLDELDGHALERLKHARMAEGVSAQTVKHHFNLIRGTWKLAKRLGYQVSELAFPQVKLPKPALRYLTSEDERRLLAELKPARTGKGLAPVRKRTADLLRSMQDAYDIVVVLLDTGARYSEIARLKRSQVALDQREIHLWRSKVQNESVLYMTDRVHDILTRRLGQPASDYVFTNKQGGPRGYAAQAIRKAIRRAGLGNCSIHTLRHTHASRLIQNGLSIYEVREVLGHSDIKTTMRYAHLESRQVTAKARDAINRLNAPGASDVRDDR